jgi:hypothetical protein
VRQVPSRPQLKRDPLGGSILSVPDWLPQFVTSRMAEAERARPESAAWLREAGGITLFGTIGGEAYLRPDGTVWYHWVVDWTNEPDRYEWREGRGNERWAALVLGARRMPELKELLPARPPATPDCPRCEGRGEIFVGRQADGVERGIVCPDCGALGWIADGAA